MRERRRTMTHYVLITAAKNEDAFIEGVLKSVLAQTLPPQEWVIVSDGSTDRTDDIVRLYQQGHPFIKLRQRPAGAKRDFASKAFALNEAYQALNSTGFEYVAILDADVTLPADYYEAVIRKFLDNPRLGVAGGRVVDFYGGSRHVVLHPDHSVRGPVQMFRRACFEQIGGLIPLEYGAEDSAAEHMARMRGWEVQAFADVEALHHRRTGTAEATPARASFRAGMAEYEMGNHWLYEFAKCIGRFREQPYILAGLMRGLGYAWAAMAARERKVPAELVCYLRTRQRRRLRDQALGRICRIAGLPSRGGQPSARDEHQP